MDSSSSRARLRLLEGLVLALGRRDEVLRVVSVAADDAGARLVVRERLGVDPDQAQAALDLQLSTVSRECTAAIVGERNHVREYVREQRGLRDD